MSRLPIAPHDATGRPGKRPPGPVLRGVASGPRPLWSGGAPVTRGPVAFVGVVPLAVEPALPGPSCGPAVARAPWCGDAAVLHENATGPPRTATAPAAVTAATARPRAQRGRSSATAATRPATTTTQRSHGR